MKKLLQFLCLGGFALSASQATAQCNELFISEYVEGTSNNKAIEIYNPTNAAINLSGYQVGRYDNGNTLFQGARLPNVMLAPYQTFVAVLDKRVVTGTGNEAPIWNGYEGRDTCRSRGAAYLIDSISGLPTVCAKPDSSLGASNIRYLRGNVYTAELNLTCRANVFLNPVYGSPNSAMYWNGDDAVALVKDTTANPDPSKVIDVVGVIGERPSFGWRNWQGINLTENRTIIRRRTVRAGVGAMISGRDTFRYADWQVLPNNTFTYLNRHICDCNPNNPASGQQIACTAGVATEELNAVEATIYPNPLNGYVLTVEAQENLREVVIMNLLGATVKRAMLNGETRGANYIDMPKLSSGLYIVNLKFENNRTAVRKLIIE